MALDFASTVGLHSNVWMESDCERDRGQALRGSGCPEEDVAVMVRSILPNATTVRQERSGVSVARNVGASLSRGRYLAFIDDDDVWHPTRLERHVAAHRANPSASFTYSDVRHIDASGSELFVTRQPRGAVRRDIAAREVFLGTPNCVVRREAFDQVGGFHSALRFAEDLDLILRLSAVGGFLAVDEALIDYRSHADSAVRRHRDVVEATESVLRLHAAPARSAGEVMWAGALDVGRRRNKRYAWWPAIRTVRSSPAPAVQAATELLWALRVAPVGLLDGIMRHVVRTDTRGRTP